jgi:hypothetical protein
LPHAVHASSISSTRLSKAVSNVLAKAVFRRFEATLLPARVARQLASRARPHGVILCMQAGRDVR